MITEKTEEKYQELKEEYDWLWGEYCTLRKLYALEIEINREVNNES